MNSSSIRLIFLSLSIYLSSSLHNLVTCLFNSASSLCPHNGNFLCKLRLQILSFTWLRYFTNFSWRMLENPLYSKRRSQIHLLSNLLLLLWNPRIPYQEFQIIFYRYLLSFNILINSFHLPQFQFSDLRLFNLVRFLFSWTSSCLLYRQ